MSEIRLLNVRRGRTGLVSKERLGLGFLTDELEEVRGLVEADSPQATPLLAALDETLDGLNVYDSPDHGRRLIAATGPNSGQAIEGLMYAEGTDYDETAFSLAKVCIWISRRERVVPKATHLINQSISNSRRLALRSRFYEIGLGNWDDLCVETGVCPSVIFWGLPVRSATRVTTVAAQEGDIQTDFYYGDWRDALAVAGLNVPNQLRNLVMDSVLGHHAAERLASTTS